ncbi:MAG TPA: ABC transporter ATP-binding protein [Acidimicrobiales bacterium]|jgi:branched-chain amino acid transport system ATP-binding protein|nr:ABC transporter ATP-binding protein [Acidimicrobiales bacterium]HXB36239.1 ABC transporter ATP-binding protein [Acidimicrobiales bacterium]
MLELRNISAGYGTGRVLENVNLVVPDGAVVALLGPNGAGKTTLLKVMSGLLRPMSGRVLLDGEDVTGASPFELARSGICHVPEGRGIFPTLSVADNLRLQAPRSVDRRAVELAAAVFPRLAQRRNQLAGTMSGGEQQMLALSRAYVAEPATVLLDEVSMGLAPLIVDEIFRYLRRIASEGISLLVVEQYVARALELADYVYILNRGRIRFAGEPAEVGDQTVLESYLGALTS